MNSKLKSLARRLGAPAWWLLGRVIPKDRDAIVINSFPDFDDTTRALANALRGTRRRLFVLTVRRGAVAPSWLAGVNATVTYRYSAYGVWLYHRARLVLFTHGCFSAWPLSPAQIVVNVWHGMPIKKIGLLDGKSSGEIPRFHYTIAADERFRSIIAGAFGVSADRVLVAEHPRLDVLRSSSRDMGGSLPPHQRLLVWLPTYRASVHGDVRVDGKESADIFAGGVDLSRIDALCAEHGALCVVKPHPMARVRPEAFARYGSILLLDDASLAARGVSLYQLLAASDVLITDVSSVYFDYKVLGRPVILYCADLQSYGASRGFVAPIESLVTDEIIESEEQLAGKLREYLRSSERTAIGDSAAQADGATSSLLGRVGA